MAKIELSDAISRRTVEALRKLAAKHPEIEEIEDGAMDPGRFFVHLTNEWVWSSEENHTQSFCSAGAVQFDLKYIRRAKGATK